MTVTDTTADALLLAIRERPDDDLVRLAYADWLDEFGGEGERQRAEFIRLQIELAMMGRPPYGAGPGVESWKHRRDELRRRERELLAANHYEWMGRPDGLATYRSPSESGKYKWLVKRSGHPASQIDVTFHRGFIAYVTLTTADFLGERCDQCEGRGFHGRNTTYQGTNLCPDCHGTGLLGGHAKAIFEAHPVTRVTLSDKERQNYHNNGGPRLYGWYRGSRGFSGNAVRQDLPVVLWDRVVKHPARIDHDNWADFEKEEDAVEALSAACIYYARRLVGLPEVKL